MITEGIAQQIDRWLDDDLSDHEQVELRAALECNPEALEYFSNRAILNQLLAKSFSGRIPDTQPALDLHKDLDSLPKVASGRKRFLPSTWVWVSSAAAISLLLFSMAFLPRATASPAELLRKTLVEYRAAMDRCYNVSVELENKPLRGRYARRAVPADSKLWVRGKSFVQIFEAPSGPLIWGRNPNGSIWFTVSGKSAAVFEANEIPEVLRDVCDLRTLDLTTLIESLLSDYDLKYADHENGIHTITAQRRSESGIAKSGTVEIEIQADSQLVRRVTIEKLNDKRPVAVVSFSLDQIQQVQNSFYELENHLQPDSPVYDRSTRFGRRSDLLRDFLQNLRFSQPSNNNQP